ncbi:hypothetical protein PINS_up007537 [Pythium insidiosum]|nr:hypothetical protein PINS_up007537 [Pythium insidiosum]
MVANQPYDFDVPPPEPATGYDKQLIADQLYDFVTEEPEPPTPNDRRALLANQLYDFVSEQPSNTEPAQPPAQAPVGALLISDLLDEMSLEATTADAQDPDERDLVLNAASPNLRGVEHKSFVSPIEDTAMLSVERLSPARHQVPDLSQVYLAAAVLVALVAAVIGVAWRRRPTTGHAKKNEDDVAMEDACQPFLG